MVTATSATAKISSVRAEGLKLDEAIAAPKVILLGRGRARRSGHPGAKHTNRSAACQHPGHHAEDHRCVRRTRTRSSGRCIPPEPLRHAAPADRKSVV